MVSAPVSTRLPLLYRLAWFFVYFVLKDDISRDKKRRAYQFVGLRIHKREYLNER